MHDWLIAWSIKSLSTHGPSLVSVCLNLSVVVAFVGSVSCSTDSLFPQSAAVAQC